MNSHPSIPTRTTADPGWCQWGEHEWMWLREKGREVITASFTDEAGRRMVEVQCTKCHVITRMDLEEYLKVSRWG